MLITETIQCPVCGQRFELEIDTSVGSHQLTTDCEVCCHPFQILVTCRPGQVDSLDVRAE